MEKIKLSEEELETFFKLDPEVIDLERSEDGRVWPVVRAYDDLNTHLLVWCIHCRTWHVHGRGGPDAPYQEGRSGKGGHRIADCICDNSPFLVRGYILHIVGKLTPDVRRKFRRGKSLYCPECRNRYSAAFNACGCSFFINKRRSPDHREVAALYQEIIADRTSSRIDWRSKFRKPK